MTNMIKTGWRIFLGALLVVLGAIMFFTETLGAIKLPEPFQSLLFAVMLGIILYGIISKNEDISRMLAVMAVILVALYYFSAKLPLAAIAAILPTILFKGIALAFVISGCFIIPRIEFKNKS